MMLLILSYSYQFLGHARSGPLVTYSVHIYKSGVNVRLMYEELKRTYFLHTLSHDAKRVSFSSGRDGQSLYAN